MDQSITLTQARVLKYMVEKDWNIARGWAVHFHPNGWKASGPYDTTLAEPRRYGILRSTFNALVRKGLIGRMGTVSLFNRDEVIWRITPQGRSAYAAFLAESTDLVVKL